MGVASSTRVPLPIVMNVGLAFEVVSSYGIAIAEYLEPTRLNINGWIGLSWVAVWTLLFTVVIPTRPLKAMLVTLASVSSVPVVIGFMVVTRRTTFNPDPAAFFFWIVFPYLLTTIMAYVGARVVYTLGKAVTEARELGSYRLVERLGQGGMGEVWRAQHRLLARPAAIKLIRASALSSTAASDEAIRRFEREAQVTAGLSSPHTVQLFDFGVADDGSFYYVMELLDGLDLETLVRRHGPVPAERVIYLLRQVCHSLAEAESRGLVHRDIKPANLFVCRYGGEYDFVKVLDFGIAKGAAHMIETGAIAFTRDNVVHGTPAYIAPEQALGGAPVDSRADIYAAGCVAYFLLTGQLVFTADTPMALVVHHAHTRPIPPSERSELPIPARTRSPGAGLPRQESQGSSAVGKGAVAPARGHRRQRAVDRRTSAGMVGSARACPRVVIRKGYGFLFFYRRPEAQKTLRSFSGSGCKPRHGRHWKECLLENRVRPVRERFFRDAEQGEILFAETS